MSRSGTEPNSQSASASATHERDIHVLQRTAEHIAENYRGTFTPEMVERYVFESYATLGRTAKIRAYLAATAGRFAADRLRALAQSGGQIAKDRPQVLFVCVQNAGRSQIAAALLAHLSGGAVEVRSAGSLPAAEIHPVAAGLMRERGLDFGEAYPKPLTDDVVRAADFVITMGCGDTCPIYPGKEYLDWDVADPEHADPDSARRVFEDVEARVAALWERVRDNA